MRGHLKSTLRFRDTRSMPLARGQENTLPPSVFFDKPFPLHGLAT